MTKDEKLESIGIGLKQLRINHGLSLRKMAKLLKCDIQRLSVLEHGKTTDPIEFLPAFCSKSKINYASHFAIQTYKEWTKIWKEMINIL